MKVKDCKSCNGCPLQALKPDNTLVSPQWGASNRLVIGEQPSEEDSISGKPFSGGDGAWLGAILPKAGVRKEEVTLLNVIQCHFNKEVFPTDSDARFILPREDGYKAVQHCLENHVKPLMKAKPWSRVDLLGDKALEFIGEKKGAYHWRGSPIEIPLLSYKIAGMPTLSPTQIAKEQRMLPAVINDLRKNLTVPAENYALYPTLEATHNYISDIIARKLPVAFDIETDYKVHTDIKLVGLSTQETTAMVVPFRGAFIDELKRLFADATEVIGHNCIQFDLPILRERGVCLNPKASIWDTMLMQHLRFPNLPHDLEFVATQFTSKPAWKFDKTVFERYCARDVDVTFAIWKQLKPLLIEHNLMNLYQEVQVPLGKICYLLHKRGFKMAPDRIKNVREKYTLDMAKEELHLPEHLKSKTFKVKRRQPAPPGTLSEKTKKPIKFVYVEVDETEQPWGSSDKVERYLYDAESGLGLPVQRDPKKDTVSTGKAALEKLTRLCYKMAGVKKNQAIRDWNAAGRSIDAIRKLRKMRSMLTLFAKEELAETAIQHPHFNVHGTASGRLSSSEPNLQNITEPARYLYVPSKPGWKIIDVDFSQIENRLTAWFANDRERLARFEKDAGFSEHKFLASKFLGVAYEEVEKTSDPDSPYIRAKKIVHGTNYGEGAMMIAKMNDLDFKQVKEMQFQWKMAIADTIRWQERTAREADKLGYLVTPFGRKRWFWTNKKYTESLSFLPQSTAADIMFRCMIALMHERIDWPLDKVQRIVKHIEPLPEPAKLILTVHDSLVLECPEEQVEEIKGVLTRVLTQPWPELKGLVIPIGIKVGNSWGECE